MGWLFYHRPKGESDLDHFNAKCGGRFIDGATKRNVFYGAYRRDEDGLVEAGVILLSRNRGEHNFGYKDMTESAGPCEAWCPKRILDLLSPVEALYGVEPADDRYSSARNAREWREACYANVAREEAARKVKPGMKVKFAQALTFTSGAVLDTLTFVKRNTFADEYGRRYIVSRWRERSFEVLA